MASTLLPAASDTATQEPPSTSRIWFGSAVVLTLGWVIFLAIMTERTANPPVVNAIQIEHSELVLVGQWANRADGRFEVARELKHGKLSGVVTVTGIEKLAADGLDRWVIPVTKSGGIYTVTHGKFLVAMPQTASPERAVPLQVQVHPQSYPATDDVLDQIQQLLSAQASAETP